MAEIKILDKVIHYEIYGCGRPIILLNGIFMSTTSWHGFIDSFSKKNQLILVDFYDQGKSSSLEDGYTHREQIELLKILINELKLSKVNLVGTSYGASIALGFTLKYQDLVEKLILANATAKTDKWLLEVGKSWEHSMINKNGNQFFQTCIPLIYSPKFFNENYDLLKKREEYFIKTFDELVYDRFLRLIRSSENYDLLDKIEEIKVDTLVLSSDMDMVTPLERQNEIINRLTNKSHLVFPNTGHASMYEKPELFTSSVLGFINFKKNIKAI